MIPVHAGTSADPGSFRDPSGIVYVAEGRVFRAIDHSAWTDFSALQMSGVLDRIVADGWVIPTKPISQRDLPSGVAEHCQPDLSHFLEHERIPYVSYPYEWPFALLKRAALHQLDLHLALLAAGFSLVDASAYNIQFRGTRPVFIDVPSIRPYREGEYWSGYRQFCEHFLNPLLLTARLGVPHHAWFRGSMEGIPVEHLARVLPWRARLSVQSWLHVTLHARLLARARTAADTGTPARPERARPMSKGGLTWMIGRMRRWIARLAPQGLAQGAWTDYTTLTSYRPDEAAAKHAFVSRFARNRQPRELLDLGCNTGDYSQAALEAAGGGRVIGFDFDQGALEAAVARADAHRLDFLPLFLDAMNPSADQGWAQQERRGFQARAKADGLLALALLHHLVIGRNVPLPQAVRWLLSLAPSGVIEFVPKQDAMVQRMLAHRDDVFPGYHIEAFREALSHGARIVREQKISTTGRTLFEYRR